MRRTPEIFATLKINQVYPEIKGRGPQANRRRRMGPKNTSTENLFLRKKNSTLESPRVRSRAVSGGNAAQRALKRCRARKKAARAV